MTHQILSLGVVPLKGAGQGGLEAYLSAVTRLRQCYCRSYFSRSYETK